MIWYKTVQTATALSLYPSKAHCHYVNVQTHTLTEGQTNVEPPVIGKLSIGAPPMGDNGHMHCTEFHLSESTACQLFGKFNSASKSQQHKHGCSNVELMFLG